MLIAINKNGKIVRAEKEILKKDKYYCPACKNRVYLKVGQVICPHFAHYHHKNCQVFSEGETNEHLKGKKELANYLKRMGKKIEVEAYLPELKQRPDLLILDDCKKTAIEFQCSSITVEKIGERTKGYLEANNDVLWILGKSLGHKKFLTALQKACLYFNPSSKRLLLFAYNIDQQQLKITFDFELNDNRKICYKKKVVALNKEEIIDLKNSQQIGKVNLVEKSIEKKQTELMKRMVYPNDSLLSFLSLIYENRENLISIPIEIYEVVASEWLIKSYSMTWKYRMIIWLESFSKKEIITEKRLFNWLKERIKNKEIEFYRMKKVTKNIFLKPFIEFLNQLTKKKIVKKRKNKSWIYLRPLERFKSYEEKINTKK